MVIFAFRWRGVFAMFRSKHILWTLGSILLLAVACEDSPVIAPSDGQIAVSASPATIVLDEFGTPPVTTGSTLVTAQIFDTNGVPQSGVTVVFSSDGGSLASAPPGQPASTMETDDSGLVSDTLTVTLGDPTSINVTVRSGTLSGSVTVTKQETAANQPPTAVFGISPANSALLNEPVIFDATLSDDPDGDTITCYRWQIETGVNIAVPELPCIPPNSRCEVQQGLGASIITRSYADAQVIAATLRVTDDPTVACLPGGPTEPVSSFNSAAAESYEIICDPTAPDADGGPNRNVTLSGVPPTVLVFLDGSGSSDPESGIASYRWTCDNGTAASDTIGVSCLYTSAGSYNARLTVTNGCGQIDTDSVLIVVNP
jgi:hypothetical protein